ncbi:MAG: FG-GAP-like repeat-containing protein [Planctomycetota bacterium]|nr:FG-GAP-like repeat-containing protein [Planctomycetota bacterium]
MFDAPQFELTDQLGTAFGAKESAGYVWVANFMFTRCTATCPRQTAKFEELQRRASRWDEWERIRLVSFTVDPENDTVERLREYAEIHHADPQHWKFLTGERADLWALSKDGFKLPVSNSATDTSVPITHSPLFFLVDSHGRIRGYYDGLSEDDFGKLLRDLRSVLSESPANSDETTHLAIPNELFDRRWLEQRRDDQLATANQLRVRHDFSFDDRVEESGIRFLNRAVSDAARDFKQNHYDHANGIAVADVDGDGLHDLYFLNQVSGGELWRNLGQGRFENTTEQAGVALAGRVAVSASFADTDNDGDPDLFVTTTRHGNAFFENNGQGHFTDATVKSGLEHVGHSSSADFFDYDRDGRLDLFLTNVGVFTTDEIGYSRDREKQDHPYFIGTDSAFAGHLFAERSEQSILYHNEGGNLFRDVSKETGLVDNGWSGDATPLDANDDGWTDLYVVNMQGNDEYYENVEGKRFERRGSQVFPNSVWGGMCVKSFDYNNDGLMDLFITNMHADMWQPWRDINGPQEKKKPRDDAVPPKSYLRSRGTGKNVFGNGFYEKQGPDLFREVSDQINAENYWPWGHSVGDLNADGFQDVFITSCMNFTFRYQTNSLLLNDHGNTFVDAEFILGVEPRRDGRVVTPWFELDCSGADKDHPECAGQSGRVVAWGALGSRSSVIFDLDQDGDLDIVTNDFNSPPMVLTSNLSEQKETLHFLKIQLRGTRSNRDGLSARVQVTIGDKVFTQVHDGQSGYISQSSLPLYFGLGDADVVDHISVQWLGGDLQEIAGPIPANQQLLIVEPDSPR